MDRGCRVRGGYGIVPDPVSAAAGAGGGADECHWRPQAGKDPVYLWKLRLYPGSGSRPWWDLRRAGLEAGDGPADGIGKRGNPPGSQYDGHVGGFRGSFSGIGVGSVTGGSPGPDRGKGFEEEKVARNSYGLYMDTLQTESSFHSGGLSVFRTDCVGAWQPAKGASFRPEPL